MAVTVATVRQRVAAAIEAVTFQPDPTVTAMAFHESRWDLVANGAEPQIAGHGAFAVLALATKFGNEVESSQRSRAQLIGLARTDIGVRWLYRLRAAAYVADFDHALDAEARIYQALTHHRSDGLRVSVLEMRREVIGDGTWLRGEVVVRTDHQIEI
jgi:hypothetical protein